MSAAINTEPPGQRRSTPQAVKKLARLADEPNALPGRSADESGTKLVWSQEQLEFNFDE